MEAVDLAIELLATGKANSTLKACKLAGISNDTFCLAMRNDPERAEKYARAREIMIDTQAQEILDEFDGPPPIGPDGRVDSGAVQWAKQRADNKKWLLSKIAPKKYGDKSQVELTGADGGPVQTVQRIELVVIDPTNVNAKN